MILLTEYITYYKILYFFSDVTCFFGVRICLSNQMHSFLIFIKVQNESLEGKKKLFTTTKWQDIIGVQTGKIL